MFESTASRTEIGDLGEFGLINRLTKDCKIQNKECIKGIGDDAAVLDHGGENLQIISKDMLVEGVHFDLTYVPLKHLGYKSMAVNFSDMAAMNGIPKQVLLGIGVSNRFSVEALDEFYSGVLLACERYGVDLVGGDTSSSKIGFCISVTVIGQVNKNKIAYRSGAKEGDLICVTGNLGGAYAGLLLLEREKQVFLANSKMQPDFKDFEYVLQRQLKPEPRIDVVKLLDDTKVVPNSMIDISDGLASEIIHLCEQSNLGCMLYENKIPIDLETCKALEEFSISPITGALSGGEDYELLFTISPKDYDKIKEQREISVIGHMTEADTPPYLVPENGSLIPIFAKGWDGLKTKK